MKQHTLSLFGQPQEKGRQEWGLFSVVEEDRAGAYRVASPRKHEVPRYANVVRIRRSPRHLTLRPARQ